MPTWPRRKRARASSPSFVRLVPATVTPPDVGASRPAATINSEDLPEPEGPRSATVSLCAMPSEILVRMLTGPAALASVRSTSSRMIACIAGLGVRVAKTHATELQQKTLLAIWHDTRPIQAHSRFDPVVRLASRGFERGCGTADQDSRLRHQPDARLWPAAGDRVYDRAPTAAERSRHQCRGRQCGRLGRYVLGRALTARLVAGRSSRCGHY